MDEKIDSGDDGHGKLAKDMLKLLGLMIGCTVAVWLLVTVVGLLF